MNNYMEQGFTEIMCKDTIKPCLDFMYRDGHGYVQPELIPRVYEIKITNETDLLDISFNFLYDDHLLDMRTRARVKYIEPLPIEENVDFYIEEDGRLRRVVVKNVKAKYASTLLERLKLSVRSYNGTDTTDLKYSWYMCADVLSFDIKPILKEVKASEYAHNHLYGSNLGCYVLEL